MIFQRPNCGTAALLNAWLAMLRNHPPKTKEIGQLGDAGLQLVRHLVLSDPRDDLRVADLRDLQLVERRKIVEQPASHLAANAVRVRRKSSDGRMLDNLTGQG